MKTMKTAAVPKTEERIKFTLKSKINGKDHLAGQMRYPAKVRPDDHKKKLEKALCKDQDM